MSEIFGTTESKEHVLGNDILARFAQAAGRFTPGNTFTRTCEMISMGYQPSYSHIRSYLEVGPVVDGFGNMVVFDGRLDNYTDISTALNLQGNDTSDSNIILQAFQKWGDQVFGHLKGDWALALWSEHEQALYLSRDHAGTRALFYECRDHWLRWATSLETLVKNAKQSVPDKNYAISFMSGQPALGRSPYQGVRCVLPAHYVRWSRTSLAETPYWHPAHLPAIRYHKTQDYQEQFFSLFRNAVERRLDGSSIVAAELSGGMDSSSIVCMADHIRETGLTSEPLQTISFFDDTEPDWNERPYFSLVEHKRRHVGIHLEVSALSQTFRMPRPEDALYFVPGADSSTLEAERRLDSVLSPKNIRVVVSGVGGDELVGGIPNPSLALVGLLEEGKLRAFGKETVKWCMATKLPMVGLLMGLYRDIGGRYSPGGYPPKRFAPWIQGDLPKDHHDSFPEMSFVERLSCKPTALGNGSTWWRLMGTLPHLSPRALARYEYRYPYLDRDLVEFLFGIPREQLQEPGFKKSLMRRSLKDIVPSEILSRRQKSLVARGPMVALRNCRATLEEILSSELRINALGFVNQRSLVSAFRDLLGDRSREFWSAFFRTMAYELWLRHAEAGGIAGWPNNVNYSGNGNLFPTSSEHPHLAEMR